VSLTTLMNERASIGAGGTQVGFDSVFKLAQKVQIDDRPGHRERRRAQPGWPTGTARKPGCATPHTVP
jgi:hypothetical protein